LGRVVRLLTTNTEEIGRVHAGWVTVFGIVVTVFGIVVTVFGIVVTVFGIVVTVFGIMVTVFGIVVTVFGIVVTVFGIVVIVFGIVACNRCEVTGGAIDAVPQKTITAWGQYIFR